MTAALYNGRTHTHICTHARAHALSLSLRCRVDIHSSKSFCRSFAGVNAWYFMCYHSPHSKIKLTSAHKNCINHSTTAVLNRTRILSTLQHMHVAVLSLKMRHNKKILTEHWQRFSAQHYVISKCQKVKHSIHVGPEVNSPTADAYRKCSFCTCSSQNTIKKKISLNQSCDLTNPQFQFWYVHFPDRISGWTANV